MTRFAVRHVVAAIGVVALSSYAWRYGRHLDNAPIRGDGVSYYVYLPAWLVDGDPPFETQARDCCGGPIADPIGVHR